MKPEADSIDWSVVHRTHEANTVADPQKAMQDHWRQCLHNLEQVSLTEPDYCRLYETYTTELRKIHEEEATAA